jgi:hypothetical protein
MSDAHSKRDGCGAPEAYNGVGNGGEGYAC